MKKLSILLISIILLSILLSQIAFAFDFKNLLPKKISSLIGKESCSDSDNGLNYNEYGFVSKGQEKVFDSCLSTPSLGLSSGLGSSGLKNYLQIGEHEGKHHTILNEKYCGIKLDKKEKQILSKEYNCNEKDFKSCLNGTCFSPNCFTQPGFIEYKGLATDIFGNGNYYSATEQYENYCKNDNTLVSYSCKTRSKTSAKYEILESNIYNHKFIINRGQEYPNMQEKRCGSGKIKLCPILGVTAEVELSGCLSGGGFAICADDLPKLSRSQLDAFCNPENDRTDIDPTETEGEITICRDSDLIEGEPNSINPNLKGILQLMQNNEIIESKEDYCTSENTLKEWYCRSGEKGFREITCENSCMSGAC